MNIDAKTSLLASAILAFPTIAQASLPDLPIAPMALNSYSAAPNKIQSAAVYDMEAELVGHVYRLDAGATGQPQTVQVELSNGRFVSVPSSNTSYYEDQNIIGLGMSRVELGLPSQIPVQGQISPDRSAQ